MSETEIRVGQRWRNKNNGREIVIQEVPDGYRYVTGARVRAFGKRTTYINAFLLPFHYALVSDD